MDDMISRQAAIKAICEDGTMLERQGKYTMTMAERKQKDADILDTLPPAQPDIPDMNVIIDTIKNAINASTGNEAYMVGLRNGMRWCWSALTDKEPEYEDMPPAQPNLSEAYSKAVFTWLMDYQIRAAELKGRYTPYEVLSWVINDWRKENG